MGRYVMLGGFEFTEGGFFKTAVGAMKQVIHDYGHINFIASRFQTHEKNNEVVARLLGQFAYHGMAFQDATLVDGRLSVAAQQEAIQSARNIFLMGGDTLAQMSTINRNGLAPLLRAFEGPLIGISAGAINMGVRSVLPLSPIRKRSYAYKGLGLVDITITPHFKRYLVDYLEAEVLPLAEKGLIYGLEEDGVVLVVEDSVQFFGGVYSIEKGLVTQISWGAADWRLEQKKQRFIDALLKPIDLGKYRLRQYTASDYSAVAALFKSPAVMEAFGGKACTTEEALSRCLHNEQLKVLRRTHFDFVIVSILEGTVMGKLGIKFKHLHQNVLEVNYMLNADYWGQGIMTTCVMGLVEKLYDIDPTIVLQGQFREDNLGSKGVLEKCGFEFLNTDVIGDDLYIRHQHRRL